MALFTYTCHFDVVLQKYSSVAHSSIKHCCADLSESGPFLTMTNFSFASPPMGIRSEPVMNCNNCFFSNSPNPRTISQKSLHATTKNRSSWKHFPTPDIYDITGGKWVCTGSLHNDFVGLFKAVVSRALLQGINIPLLANDISNIIRRYTWQSQKCTNVSKCSSVC